MNYRDILLSLALGAAVESAHAATAVEERILDAPMPHQALGGSQHMAHYVRLEGKRGAELARGMRKSLDIHLQSCAAMNRKTGKPVNLPKELPDFELHYVHDTYFAPNRTIQYRRHYVAGVNMDDCSLDEKEVRTAVLSSSAGSCRIDLGAKTAKGACDAAAHANAPARTYAPAGGPSGAQADPQAMAAIARLAKAAGVSSPVPAPASAAAGGSARAIAGAQCGQIATADGGSVCLARAGSFPVQTAYGALPNGGIILASSNGRGDLTDQATQAAFDKPVSDAVFEPHVRGGFQISRGRE